ncbi:unnamed protein product [Cyprideis torosa]|uniref:Uncharacterized protein n=1 Tax=Cyprideis torosa TaxID=163714 RepID=A0A7R8ZLE1_9CRUS|nr:unnamed protein product [Cyprideis torosa]CAG0882074.1 unnamed protein product [Cyprideis torosa]
MMQVALLLLGIGVALADKAAPPYRPAAAYEPEPQGYAPVYKSPPPKPSYQKKYEEPEYNDKDVVYQYGYNVQDAHYGTAFSKQENRNGEHLEGQYQVALPDSTIQTVRYRVDPYEGFIADVSYEGTPVYPKYEPKKYDSPSYKPAPYQPSSYKSPEPTYTASQSYEEPTYLDESTDNMQVEDA